MNDPASIGISRKKYRTQSFTYEDFVEGIKPNFNEGENELTYKIEDGIFKKLSNEIELESYFDDELNSSIILRSLC